MTAPLIALLLLAIVAGLGFAVVSWVARNRGHYLRSLLLEKEDLVGTERRMFSYLHELGAAIAAEQRESALHKMIVEGAVKVTDSVGGVLYTFDEAKGTLVPRFVSAGGAPLTPLSESALGNEAANPGSLLSWLRLQHVPGSDALLGAIFTTQSTEHIPDIDNDKRLVSGKRNVWQAGKGAMIGPLTSGNRKIGVLAVTSPNQERTYDSNDLEVFAAIAEQSAFALASASAHQEMQKKRKLEDELRTAGEVQRILLPDENPAIKGYAITGRNRPAMLLSGDFFDYVQPDAGRFGAVIADVSGKGFPAALIATTCRSSLQAHAQAQASPSSVLSAVNRQIFDDINEDMFVSAIYFILEEGGSAITLARAGHPEPMIWRKATGSVEILPSPGLGLGIDQGEVFDRVTHDTVIHLEPGDCLLLYTDGVNEAENAEGDQFGEDRIREILARTAPNGTAAIVDAIIAAVDEFCGNQRPSDDITLVALQRKDA